MTVFRFYARPRIPATINQEPRNNKVEVRELCETCASKPKCPSKSINQQPVRGNCMERGKLILWFVQNNLSVVNGLSGIG